MDKDGRNLPSELATRRAANHIAYLLNTIFEEAPNGGWYAADRFINIAIVAQAAALGAEDTCEGQTDVPPAYFDKGDIFG